MNKKMWGLPLSVVFVDWLKSNVGSRLVSVPLTCSKKKIRPFEQMLSNGWTDYQVSRTACVNFRTGYQNDWTACQNFRTGHVNDWTACQNYQTGYPNDWTACENYRTGWHKRMNGFTINITSNGSWKTIAIKAERIAYHSDRTNGQIRCHSRYGPPSQIWTYLSNFPFKHPLYHIWQLILFASYLSMFFSITTQHSSIKV